MSCMGCTSVTVKEFVTEKEAKLQEIETILNFGCIVPIIGIIPGTLKIGLGTIQLIAAIAILIIFSLPSIWNQTSQELAKSSLRHIGHGIANIVGGVFLSIPFLGYLLVVLKIGTHIRNNPQDFPSLMHKNVALLSKAFDQAHTIEKKYLVFWISYPLFDDSKEL